LTGTEIVIGNIAEARTPTEDISHPEPLSAGRYILPLTSDNKGMYRIAELPRSPGFEHFALFIYPDMPVVRQQMAEAVQGLNAPK
jgi:hypothetical protein